MDERKGYICDTALRDRLKAARRSVADRPVKESCVLELVMPMLRGNVMVYISMRDELSTSKLISRLMIMPDVNVLAPYTVGTDITPRPLRSMGRPDSIGNLPDSCYGVGTVKPDVCVTPLLGFDKNGYRIGYGKGCYDRFFARVDTYKIGLAFDAQHAVFEHAAHDIPLDCCVTESGVIYFDHASDIG